MSPDFAPYTKCKVQSENVEGLQLAAYIESGKFSLEAAEASRVLVTCTCIPCYFQENSIALLRVLYTERENATDRRHSARCIGETAVWCSSQEHRTRPTAAH